MVVGRVCSGPCCMTRFLVQRYRSGTRRSRNHLYESNVDAGMGMLRPEEPSPSTEEAFEGKFLVLRWLHTHGHLRRSCPPRAPKLLKHLALGVASIIKSWASVQEDFVRRRLKDSG